MGVETGVGELEEDTLPVVGLVRVGSLFYRSLVDGDGYRHRISILFSGCVDMGSLSFCAARHCSLIAFSLVVVELHVVLLYDVWLSIESNLCS